MKTFRILTSILLLLAPFAAQPCADFSADQSRFWLFMPEAAEMRDMLPFTYFLDDSYYPNSSGIMENTKATLYSRNTAEWAALTDNKVSKEAIHEALYKTSSAAYFSAKKSQNAFLAWLAAKGNEDFKRYFDFAKRYEALFADVDPWDESGSRVDLAKVENLAKDLENFMEKTKNPALRLRAAYLAVKCHRNRNDYARATAVFKKIENTGPKESWIYGSLCYLQGAIQKDSVQQAVWYARAWKYNSEAPIEIQRFFNKNAALPFLSQVQNKEEAALMLGIVALNNPSEQLVILEKINTLQPDIPLLSQLFLREINKIENWLFTEKITGQDIPTGSYASEKGTAEFYKAKVAYLHQLRAFVEKICKENKRKDAGFWQMSRAHLAFLDEDFDLVPTAAALAKKANLSDLQTFQLEVTEFLARYAKNKKLTDALESQFVDLLHRSENFSKTTDDWNGNVNLASRLRLFMFKKLKEEGRTAAGCLLLGDMASTLSVGYYGWMPNYDPLLTFGKATDFDEALRIIEQPKGALENYIQAQPIAYREDWGNGPKIYDEKTGGMVQNPDYKKPTWDKGKILDLKSMYLMRYDNKTEALKTLKQVQSSFWNAETQYAYQWYFKQNPFSVNALPKGVTLPMPKDSIFSKIDFLEKYLALQTESESNPAAKAANYFLLANAEFNMSYAGRGWFLMNHSGKSSGEIPWYDAEDQGSIPNGGLSNPWSHTGAYSLAVLSMALGLVFYGKKKRPTFIFCLLLTVCAAFFFTCKGKEEATSSTANSDEANQESNDAYYKATRARGLYEKAIAAAPNSEIATVSYAMILKCDAQADYYNNAFKLPLAKQNQSELLKSLGKPTVSSQLMSCKDMEILSKKMGW